MKNALRVKLMGGLGNQMFQYAFGKAYNQITGRDVLIDTALLSGAPSPGFTQRNYELEVFDISLPKIPEVNGWSTGLARFINNCTDRLFASRVMKEESYHYSSAYFSNLEAKSSIGYFQSERYFAHIKELILKDFTFKENVVDSKNLDLAYRMKNNRNSVSIHIRRGDYVSVPGVNSFHGVCSVSYYERSINFISSRLGDLDLYFFSDDIEWVKYNFSHLKNSEFVSHNFGDKSFLDMYLMSNCSHNIIANSSFSWWGGWLNKNIDKIVVAPKEWFASSIVNTNDLIPESWIKL